MLLCIMAISSQVINHVSAQNPNWTLPGWYFETDPIDYSPLPQSSSGYSGALSEHVHAGIKTTHDEFAFYVVDGEVTSRCH